MDLGLFELSLDVGEAIKALADVKARLVDTTIMEEIGRQGLEIIKELLRPLRRSGETEDSWKYRIEGQKLIFYSDNDAATYLATGFRKAPSTQKLRQWMSYKSEFSGLSDKEANRVAYAIRRAIITGKAPGPSSDIGKLQPVGERKYDYVKLATDQIRLLVNAKLNTLTG